ncbi:MAG: cell envelope integrity protein CreD [Pseudomonadota bacterium]|nr:cell envelope integrity protein CreD [Pseudomonadota bacterium]
MKLFLKIAIVVAMTIGILIALMLIFGVIKERKYYRAQVVADIAANVGGEQTVAGPVLIVPWTEVKKVRVIDDKGVERIVEQRDSGRWTFFPETLDARGTLTPDVRKRGLHAVRVYDWQGEVGAGFEADIPTTPADVERDIGKPYLSWVIADVRGLRGTPVIEVNGQRVVPEQGSRIAERSGLHVGLAAPAAGDVLKLQSKIAMTLAGTERFGILPLARSNSIKLKSSWPHPSFSGILPRHDTSAQGFDADWQVNALATTAQQNWGESNWQGIGGDIARVALIDPVNPYLMAERATKYGLLFVVLTFIGFFMFELIKQVRVHPVQYALVGLAIAIFFLLLLSLSEHIAFGLAYLAAALACIGLIGFYLSAVLGGVLRGLGFASMLATLYAALYGLLLMEDNALVLGSGLLFVILAAIMVATRKLDWYAMSGGRPQPAVASGTE